MFSLSAVSVYCIQVDCCYFDPLLGNNALFWHGLYRTAISSSSEKKVTSKAITSFVRVNTVQWKDATSLR